MVWDFDLSEYLSLGRAELNYKFDPTYLDFCHPNHPDCISGVTCTECAAPSNPILKVSGKVVSFSNENGVILGIHHPTETPSFDMALVPNPAHHQLTLKTDYDKGAVSVMILNLQGQAVMYFSVEGERTIDVSPLSPGLYIVKMLGGSALTKKLLIE